jgi:hypothetical protein
MHPFFYGTPLMVCTDCRKQRAGGGEGGRGLEEEKTKYDKGAEHDQKTGDKILLNFFLCECCKKEKDENLKEKGRERKEGVPRPA